MNYMCKDKCLTTLYFHHGGSVNRKRHLNKYSTPLAFRGMQIKALMIYHYIPIRLAKIQKKKKATPNAGRNSKNIDHSSIPGCNLKWYSYFEIQFISFYIFPVLGRYD